ncbi:unnamed protein product [Strongylus vulgaris]|uniref:Uncharacterized protein n=1 Tax=Strongylus vulgaris TaxID=40348 RepID=A0A3P7IRP4_STRVU|nr:unnamed protein product [Strongylus vulgaris]
MPHLYTDGMHQPFQVVEKLGFCMFGLLFILSQNSFTVGAEFDDSKYIFDFQQETLMKRDEELIDISHTRISLPIPGSNQRLPFKAHMFERFNDIDLNFAQVIPSLNSHNIRKDNIVDELVTNSANPSVVG